MFKRVLVANRGEIAVRIMRTLREMGIVSIAAFSDVDSDALFVQEADEAYRLGPAPAAESYLNVQALVRVARESRSGAVHPGYGFLAENADFADAVEGAGMTFIGPSPASMRAIGDKVRARRLARSLDVPLVPGTEDATTSLDAALAFADRHGYPLAVKASGGGGGRGIRVVQSSEGMRDALEGAEREARSYFKNPDVYLERYFPHPRHVEIQVLGDRHGHLIHLGERECSIQRRRQKLIEEAPCPAFDTATRERVGEMALRMARAAQYWSAGTVEFLMTQEGDVYFLEMNTRIQVEHPVTELVADCDLIREMVLIAAGETLTEMDSLASPRGHAFEIRINAEDPTDGFRPTPAAILRYREPGGIGTRVDSGVYQGYSIPSSYDSLMSKVVVWAPDRERARQRALRALHEYVIEGPSTTIGFARAILEHPAFMRGEAATTFVEENLAQLVASAGTSRAVLADSSSETRVARGESRRFEVEVNRRFFSVQVAEVTEKRPASAGAGPGAPLARMARRNSDPDLLSPMHGTVVGIKKAQGERVNAGETLFVIEAMKMENEVAAQRTGTLTRVDAHLGETVESGETLARIE
ncbi:MAG: acetyl/propionyl/methylcrotonyl-CoA carboxylase subunit alpha [Chloroflexota bacterium]|nr:MAG: carbamoyl phosphate synthase [Chloroflexota bacterium]